MLASRVARILTKASQRYNFPWTTAQAKPGPVLQRFEPVINKTQMPPAAPQLASKLGSTQNTVHAGYLRTQCNSSLLNSEFCSTTNRIIKTLGLREPQKKPLVKKERQNKFTENDVQALYDAIQLTKAYFSNEVSGQTPTTSDKVSEHEGSWTDSTQKELSTEEQSVNPKASSLSHKQVSLAPFFGCIGPGCLTPQKPTGFLTLLHGLKKRFNPVCEGHHFHLDSRQNAPEKEVIVTFRPPKTSPDEKYIEDAFSADTDDEYYAIQELTFDTDKAVILHFPTDRRYVAFMKNVEVKPDFNGDREIDVEIHFSLPSITDDGLRDLIKHLNPVCVGQHIHSDSSHNDPNKLITVIFRPSKSPINQDFTEIQCSADTDNDNAIQEISFHTDKVVLLRYPIGRHCIAIMKNVVVKDPTVDRETDVEFHFSVSSKTDAALGYPMKNSESVENGQQTLANLPPRLHCAIQISNVCLSNLTPGKTPTTSQEASENQGSWTDSTLKEPSTAEQSVNPKANSFSNKQVSLAPFFGFTGSGCVTPQKPTGFLTLLHGLKKRFNPVFEDRRFHSDSTQNGPKKEVTLIFRPSKSSPKEKFTEDPYSADTDADEYFATQEITFDTDKAVILHNPIERKYVAIMENVVVEPDVNREREIDVEFYFSLPSITDDGIGDLMKHLNPVYNGHQIHSNSSQNDPKKLITGIFRPSESSMINYYTEEQWTADTDNYYVAQGISFHSDRFVILRYPTGRRYVAIMKNVVVNDPTVDREVDVEFHFSLSSKTDAGLRDSMNTSESVENRLQTPANVPPRLHSAMQIISVFISHMTPGQTPTTSHVSVSENQGSDTEEQKQAENPKQAYFSDEEDTSMPFFGLVGPGHVTQQRPAEGQGFLHGKNKKFDTLCQNHHCHSDSTQNAVEKELSIIWKPSKSGKKQQGSRKKKEDDSQFPCPHSLEFEEFTFDD